MKILIVDRYFVPDTAPYAMIVHPIARRWVKDGHSVSVLAAQPSYNVSAKIARQPKREEIDGISVTRVGLLRERKRGLIVRLINLIIYAFHVSIRIVSDRRLDAVMVCTTNPVILPMIVGKLCKLISAKLIYHCQDIFPEAAAVSGLMRSGPLFNLLARIDNNTCASSFAVAVLSDDMGDTLRARNANHPGNIVTINNFILPNRECHASLPHSYTGPVDQFRVLFAGNIGKLQGVEYLVRAAVLLKENEDIRFHIVGDGVAKPDITKIAAPVLGEGVFFHDHQPISVVKRMIGLADLCVISLGRDVYKIAYPSKTMTTLSAGGCVLACVETQSELARIVLEERLGYVVEPEDEQAIAKTILRAREERDQLEGMRRRARNVAASRFGERPILDQWSQLARSIEKAEE